MVLQAHLASSLNHDMVIDYSDSERHQMAIIRNNTKLPTV